MNKFLVILSFILIVLSGYMFFILKCRDGAGNGSTVTSDTIYILKIDTVIKEKLKPYKVEVLKYVTDTLMSVDSIPVEVNIPVSKQFYCDTVTVDKDSAIISSVITGYHVNYDSLNVVLKSSNKIVTNTVTIKPRNKKFYIGPYVGVSISGNKIQPNVGIGITYSFWSF